MQRDPIEDCRSKDLPETDAGRILLAIQAASKNDM
jgi:hypothetical protein